VNLMTLELQREYIRYRARRGLISALDQCKKLKILDAEYDASHPIQNQSNALTSESLEDAIVALKNMAQDPEKVITIFGSCISAPNLEQTLSISNVNDPNNWTSGVQTVGEDITEEEAEMERLRGSAIKYRRLFRGSYELDPHSARTSSYRGDWHLARFEYGKGLEILENHNATAKTLTTQTQEAKKAAEVENPYTHPFYGSYQPTITISGKSAAKKEPPPAPTYTESPDWCKPAPIGVIGGGRLTKL